MQLKKHVCVYKEGLPLIGKLISGVVLIPKFGLTKNVPLSVTILSSEDMVVLQMLHEGGRKCGIPLYYSLLIDSEGTSLVCFPDPEEDMEVKLSYVPLVHVPLMQEF